MLGTIDGHAIGSHPLVARFIKGVGRLRPPTCKYKTTWDASIVLKFLSNWSSNSELCLRDLSMKLAALFALCSAQRVQSLTSIQINEITFTRTYVIINISSRLKTSTPGNGLQLKFSKFSNPKLCIFSCLDEYIKRTAVLRNGSQLLVVTNSPYGPASSQTISNWLKKVLELSGISVETFSSHSYRHSSTSKALSLGVNLDTIFKSAGWSENSKVFARFYNKPIEPMSTYSNSILSSVRNRK